MTRHLSRREEDSGFPPEWKRRVTLLEYVFAPSKPWFSLSQIYAAVQRDPHRLRRCTTFSRSPRHVKVILELDDVTYEMEIYDGDRAKPALLWIKATWP